MYTRVKVKATSRIHPRLPTAVRMADEDTPSSHSRTTKGSSSSFGRTLSNASISLARISFSTEDEADANEEEEDTITIPLPGNPIQCILSQIFTL